MTELSSMFRMPLSGGLERLAIRGLERFIRRSPQVDWEVCADAKIELSVALIERRLGWFMFIKRRQVQRGLRLMEEFANSACMPENQRAAACVYLGVCLSSNSYAPIDFSKSFSYFEKAVALGANPESVLDYVTRMGELLRMHPDSNLQHFFGNSAAGMAHLRRVKENLVHRINEFTQK